MAPRKVVENGGTIREFFEAKYRTPNGRRAKEVRWVMQGIATEEAIRKATDMMCADEKEMRNLGEQLYDHFYTEEKKSWAREYYKIQYEIRWLKFRKVS